MLDTRTRAALSALCTKYRTMRALRVQAEPELDPRPQLHALAREFPGALRELDQLPMDLIDARLAELERTLETDEQLATWMRLQIGYHGFMRAVLRIRRLSHGRSMTFSDAAAELAELDYQPASDEPPAERFGLAELRTIRRPPAGRLNPWVLAQVAADCGTTPDAVQKALFSR